MVGESLMRAQYWVMMTQKKFHLFYLGYQLGLYVKIERWMNVILAIISTGSLIGLFAWDEGQKILAIILALAQIVTAARPFLPFERRVNELDKGILLLNRVYSDIEKKWNEINIEGVEDSQINEFYYNYLKQWEEVDGEILQKDSLPYIEKYYTKAGEDNERYFINLFGGNE